MMPPTFGGACKCPTCGKSVYFAEEVRALGKSYHKLCLKCTVCNKLLDSTNVNNHEDKLFCKSCYGKNYGPKGYGFAGGSSGLSTDTGVPYQITRDYMPHTAEAYGVPRTDTKGGDQCGHCGKAVYFAEKIHGAGQIFHRACFACSSCRKSLDSVTVTVHEEVLYCKACYGKKYGPKGYGFGGGGALLSAETSNGRSVPAYTQAQAAPLVESKGDARFGGSDTCPRCGKSVYAAEKLVAVGKAFHKFCFTCGLCNKKLDSSTLRDRDGELYCNGENCCEVCHMHHTLNKKLINNIV